MLRCGECPIWVWKDHTYYGLRLHCDNRPRYTTERCDQSPMDLRREATRLRHIADALDKAAEMREREEAQP